MFRNEEEYVAESYNFDEEETVLVSTPHHFSDGRQSIVYRLVKVRLHFAVCSKCLNVRATQLSSSRLERTSFALQSGSIRSFKPGIA